jgi:hypothetical protein
MIESRYWKEDLLAHARRLRPVKRPKRWSERGVVNFEKELMISFFMVRALLERGKLSTKVQSHKVQVTKYPWNGKPVTILNFADVDELYDFGKSVESSASVGFISNQFVHARTIYASRNETKNWSHVLLCSDFERKKAIYLVPVAQIQRIFHLVAEDDVTWSRLVYDPKIGDYRLTIS